MNEDRIKIFANPKCKKCHGTGKLRYQTGVVSKTIRKNEGALENKIYCGCVTKNIQKYS